jgi:hypothetical protein
VVPWNRRGVQTARFPWPETGERLVALAAKEPSARADAQGRAFVAEGTDEQLVVPFVLPPPRPFELAADYGARLPARIGRQCVLLLQAGAMALGYWDEDELLRHKAGKRYVVRGSGKAQPLHQKTRGKSRYGSRLRLQNWQRLLADVNGKLQQWWDELGPPEQVFHSVPVRSLHDLFAAEPPPPFPRDDARLRRIPRHVHVPDHEELLAVRRWLAYGRSLSAAPP